MVCAFNKAARWRALVALALYRDKYSKQEEKVKILLRDKACCYNCIIDQASLFAEKCFVILCFGPPELRRAISLSFVLEYSH